MPPRLLPLISLYVSLILSITLLSLLTQPSCELSHKNENSINSGEMRTREEEEAEEPRETENRREGSLKELLVDLRPGNSKQSMG